MPACRHSPSPAYRARRQSPLCGQRLRIILSADSRGVGCTLQFGKSCARRPITPDNENETGGIATVALTASPSPRCHSICAVVATHRLHPPRPILSSAQDAIITHMSDTRASGRRKADAFRGPMHVRLETFFPDHPCGDRNGLMVLTNLASRRVRGNATYDDASLSSLHRS